MRQHVAPRPASFEINDFELLSTTLEVKQETPPIAPPHIHIPSFKPDLISSHPRFFKNFIVLPPHLYTHFYFILFCVLCISGAHSIPILFVLPGCFLPPPPVPPPPPLTRLPINPVTHSDSAAFCPRGHICVFSPRSTHVVLLHVAVTITFCHLFFFCWHPSPSHTHTHIVIFLHHVSKSTSIPNKTQSDCRELADVFLLCFKYGHFTFVCLLII